MSARAARAATMLLVIACACQPSRSRERALTAPPPPAVPDAELLQDLSLLARRRLMPEAEVDTLRRALARRDITLAAHIDRLLSDREFAYEVVPRLLLRAAVRVPAGAAISYVLKSTASAGGEPIYFLWKPCTADKAERVRPWWDPDRAVLVCADSYRPDVYVALRKVGDLAARCDALFARLGDGPPECGCGPYLMRCARDDAHRAEIEASLIGEVRDTVGYLFTHDRPLREVFTSNASFRDWNAEFYYVRWQAEIDHGKTLERDIDRRRSWPAGGRWAARPELRPGQHAGVLTMPQMMLDLADRRQRIVAVIDYVLCAGHDSSGATAKSVLSLGTKTQQFLQDGWRELAARPICTNCHARMEYGWQFFTGYPDGRLARHFIPELQTDTTGKMYGANIGDPRGTGTLSPLGFAQHSLAQPEFARCMAKTIAGHVFGRADRDQLEQLTGGLAEQIATEPRIGIRTLARRALLAYAAERMAAIETDSAVDFQSARAPAARGGAIQLSSRVRGLIESRCSACHDGDDAPSLDGQSLPRELAIRVIDQVSLDRMPKGQPLPAAERLLLIRDMVEAVWTTVDDRRTAFDYFDNHLGGTPVHGIEASLSAIRHSTGATPDRRWNVIETQQRSEELAFTPNFAAITSLEAIAACHAAGHTGDQLAPCITRELDVTVHER